MERLIMTMPIAPYSQYSLGKLSTPILAESLAKKIGGKSCFAVNALSSYQDRKIEDYKKLLEKHNIIPDMFWIDKENIEYLLDKIYLLISRGFIYKTYKNILFCDCKKVEICSDYICSINMVDSCFFELDGKYYCKHCKNECNLSSEEVLVFNPNLLEKFQLLFYPHFINKDIKTFEETIRRNDIVISRLRDTGIYIHYDNKIYNVDIDFLWEVYLSLFGNYEKIVMCSNHQLYQLYMVMMLEKCFDINSKTIGLATPYINCGKNEIEDILKDRNLSLKLFLLYNLRWQKKENNIDNGLLSYLTRMNVKKLYQLYDITMQEHIEDALLNNLEKILLKDFNFQNANNILKRRRKND